MHKMVVHVVHLHLGFYTPSYKSFIGPAQRFSYVIVLTYYEVQLAAIIVHIKQTQTPTILIDAYELILS